MTDTTKLSLVIALKNEALNLPNLFQSIDQLNFNKDNLEIIFVDDNSSDDSYELIKSFIKEKNNCVLLKADQKKYAGKKGALQAGIEAAKNNFIVITDADCQPEPEWLNEIASALNYGYDFIFGIAPLLSGKSLVKKISAYESLKNNFLTIAAVGLNIPYSAAARSFAFRKKSFERIGGYANTTETLSGDDDLLLREAVKNKMLIGTITEPESFVYSRSPDTLNEYLTQKKRHLQTSHHYLPKQKLFLAFWHLANIISFLSIGLFFISPILVLPFAVKMVFDLFMGLKHQNDLGHSFKFYEIFYLQIAFEVLLIVNFINSLYGKVKWK